MKLPSAAALALVGWYLMRPPLPHLNAHATRTDTAAPYHSARPYVRRSRARDLGMWFSGHGSQWRRFTDHAGSKPM